MTESPAQRNRIIESYGYPARRLLGQVLVEGEFITRRELEQALERQRHTNELLGEALVGMGALDPIDLTVALSVQGELSSAQGALRSAAGGRQLLGTLLLSAKRITPEQLDQALAEQIRTGEKIGAILIRRGSLSREELDAVLAFQEHQGKGAEAPSSLRLGEILVATGQITRRQLDLALSRQGTTGGKLGELLVESGYVAPQQVSCGLAIQKKLVTAALMAALSMAASMEATSQEVAGMGTSAGRDSAKVEVSATVLPRTTLTVRSQPRMLVVTREDIRRGYVEVPAASRIEVVSNDPRGYLLVFENHAGPEALFREVIIEGLGRQVQIGPSGGWIPRTETLSPMAAELSYRFSLAEDARPGTYPWPLSLSTRTL
jgi:hypothetical protein